MKTWIAIFVIMIAAVFFARHHYSAPTPPMKKDLGRVLGIAPADLIKVETGSDAGGCSWDESKTEEKKIYRKMADKLLRMSLYEMTDDAPAGCKKAYYAAEDINRYTFVGGKLTIPPSKQYPPVPDTSSAYFKVQFRKSGPDSEPVEFCLEEAVFKAAVSKITEEPALADCEI